MLNQLESALRRRSAQKHAGESYAAVAIILHDDPVSGPNVLVIERAERIGDPWSGHLAFPGGRVEPDDESLLATATRETREEVGLDLQCQARHLGALDQQRARRPEHGLIVAPFVFLLTKQVDPTPDAREVAKIHWLPLRPLLSGEYDVEHTIVFNRVRYKLPAFRVDNKVLWGLTYVMLSSLLAPLRPDATLTS